MSGSPATILIVDDEIQNRKLLEALLRPEGYVMQSVATGEDALASIAQRAPDLILLDIMMPGMDGYQLANILKANVATSSIPIIMVTAQIDRRVRLAGLNAGAEEFLTKPVDRAELWLRVRNLLRLKTLNDLLQNHRAILEREVQARTADLQRFRTAMDATADAIFLTCRNTMHFVEVNTAACKMLGYTHEELLQIGPAQTGRATQEEFESIYDAIIAGDCGDELKETKIRRKDGSHVPVEVQQQAQRSGADWLIVSVMRDITERKRLHHMAHYDALTGLPNRTLFYQALRKTLAQAADSDWLVAILFIDLDHFKEVNDTLGHAIGDELLIQFSNRLVQCMRIRDTVGRLGGDEFALILVMQEDQQEGQQDADFVANKVCEVVRAPFEMKGHEVNVTASIGITVYPVDASDPETLLKYADTAMYRAKQAGRDTYLFFTAQMNAEVLARRALEAALHKAVENGEFVLHYQPKVQLSSGRITGLEALLRWERPGHGLVPPQDFIQVLEDTGLSVRVGSWVIATACKQIGLWMRSAIGSIPVSVNASGRQFIEGDLDGDVIKGLLDNHITADLLELELTESTLMIDTERTMTSLHHLKTRGVQISIDDFGTGYSSLAYLRRFPIDKLKIDIAFIRDVISNPDDAAIAQAIISMAHSLKLDVIAEGVETAAQLRYLRRHHCDQIQGYYFSPPLPVPELERMLREKRTLLPPPKVGPAGSSKHC